MIGEDGAEGHSHLFRRTPCCRRRVGAPAPAEGHAEAIDAINNRVTQLMSQEANLLLAKAGEPVAPGGRASAPTPWPPHQLGMPGCGTHRAAGFSFLSVNVNCMYCPVMLYFS